MLHSMCKVKGGGVTMITLNFAMVAMMIGFSVLPMHTENMHTPMTYPTAKVEIVDIEVINREIVPVAPIEKKETPGSINQNKTYEQCMKEAFERIYEEVNRLLDQIPDHADEQFKLQNMM